jgi:hypothetical protein
MGAIAEYKPERAMAATQEEQQRAATTYQVQSEAAEKQSLANTNGLAKREPVGGTLTAAAPMAQIDARAPRSGTFDSGGRLKSSGAFAAYRVNSPTLPSGLPALSTATTRSYALAVDRAGAVFLSEDSGSHWESITKQWTGRAVTIRVEPVVSARESATVSPAAVFEITNDQGQVWVSTGGRIWKAK